MCGLCFSTIYQSQRFQKRSKTRFTCRGGLGFATSGSTLSVSSRTRLMIWAQERSLMGQVYGNGLFNIAASSSSDNSGGLFFDREPRTVRPAVVTTGWQDCPPSTYTVHKSYLWKDSVLDAVLNKRGWVLQERVLLPSMLHFTSDQLLGLSRTWGL
ncbi:hypothetical protein N657DRAFT_448954 [Parathielavia appendiculata]|uniref:Heterokaryon incompatibility domain-containing protein n=1 Tax=Parathielavia appendiculata TaxID=2587402 RepID=A0AAN6Z361_9PEZI|nr:hypothetical protein N657DRAFT_448954 [Parathielavia appendiculata]